MWISVWSTLWTALPVLADPLDLDRSTWTARVALRASALSHSHLISLHTCWTTGVTMAVARSLNEHGLTQSWTVDLPNLDEDHFAVFVVDLSCASSVSLLTQASHLRKFTLRSKWLLLSNSSEETPTDVLEHHPWLHQLNVFPDSDVVLATGEDTEWVSLYRVGRSSPMIPVALGSDRSDLRREKLKASTVLFQPTKFKGFYNDYLRDVDTWPKVHYPVVVNLAQQLNFNLELWTVDDYGWEQNNSFDGLMGQLQRREIDFAATGFFMRADRIRVVDFTAETYHIRTTILFRQPSLSSVSNIFILPFSSEVWVCLLVLCVVVILIFSIEMVTARHWNVYYPMMRKASFMDIVSLVLGCVCQQGSYMVPEKLSGRITLFFMSLTALFFFTSYSANIVALLQSPSSALVNLNDLTTSPLDVGIQDLNYNRVYFKESIDLPTRLLYQKKVMPKGQSAYYTPLEGIRRVREDMFAFNVETNLGYKIISETFMDTEKCALSEIQLFPMPILSIPVSKRSGYRDLFTQKIRWQRETGILHRNAKLWLPQKPQCEDIRGGTGFVSVGLKEIMPALKVLFYGMTLAVLLLIVEALFHHRNKLFMMRKFESMCRKKEIDRSEEMWDAYLEYRKKQINPAENTVSQKY